MDKAQARQLIFDSLKLLIQRDGKIIKKKVKEECINHRLACHLEQLLNRNSDNNIHYDVDLEYNKNRNDPKKIIVDEHNSKAIRPDIIIHERFSHNNNLIAFEIKKNYTDRNDLQKIKGLLGALYNYTYGCLISYLPDNKNYIRVRLLPSNAQVITEDIFRVSKR
jgi:hypothetical protein